MVVIILGSPGSGKGTQAERVAKKLDIVPISTGQLLRDEVAKGTQLGKEVEPFMLRGEWVPAEKTIQVLTSKLDTIDLEKGFVLDAFPRLLDELMLFESYLKSKGQAISIVLNLKVDDQVSLHRIQERRASKSSKKKFRKDESDEVTLKRINLHHKTVEPILDHFRALNLLYEVNGNLSVDEVYNQIEKILVDKFDL